MSEHTPGPWITIFAYKGGSRIVHCTGADGTVVLECSAPESDLVTANVNLALSAPELLEALLALTKVCRDEWIHDEFDEFEEPFIKAEQLIAKVRGESWTLYDGPGGEPC